MQGRGEQGTESSDGEAAQRTRRPVSSTPAFVPSPVSDTKSKDSSAARPRKRYTITKVRENWTTQEHQRFLDAIKLYNREWKKIEEFIGTKSVKQIRSHAQKYFLKVQKHGGSEFIPPARPKRKASPSDSGSSRRSPEENSPSFHSSRLSSAPASHLALPSQSSTNPASSAGFSNWMSANGLIMPAPVFPQVPPNGALHPLAPILPPNHDDIARLRRTQEQFAQAQMSLNNAMSAAAPYTAPSGAPPQQPNYAKIYAFLGSLFDPATDNHVEALNLMSPVDRETVQIMMNNLAVNLHNSILSMERGGDASAVALLASGGALTGSGGLLASSGALLAASNSAALHSLKESALPPFRAERPRLSDDSALHSLSEGRPTLGGHSALHPAMPAFGHSARRDLADHSLDAPSLHQYMESPQQLRQEHGALYSAQGADYTSSHSVSPRVGDRRDTPFF